MCRRVRIDMAIRCMYICTCYRALKAGLGLQRFTLAAPIFLVLSLFQLLSAATGGRNLHKTATITTPGPPP
jgi:hypothetical protein